MSTIPNTSCSVAARADEVVKLSAYQLQEDSIISLMKVVDSLENALINILSDKTPATVDDNAKEPSAPQRSALIQWVSARNRELNNIENRLRGIMARIDLDG